MLNFYKKKSLGKNYGSQPLHNDIAAKTIAEPKLQIIRLITKTNMNIDFRRSAWAGKSLRIC